MPKVKLLQSRVRWDSKLKRYVSDKAGDVVDVSMSAAATLVSRFQAELIPVVPFGGDAETKQVETATSGTESDDSGSTAETFSDLAELQISDQQLDLLLVDDANENVPAFDTIDQLRKWLLDGGKLSDKKGIGNATEAAIVAALADYDQQSAE
jgi:hypothetical protein